MTVDFVDVELEITAEPTSVEITAGVGMGEVNLAVAAEAVARTDADDDLAAAIAAEIVVREADDLALQADIDTKATPADVAAAVAGLVDAAPGTLDTLNELAAALGDDPNFAATITAALAAKATAADITAALVPYLKKPNADSWPIYLYGNSYSVLSAGFFTAGNHWSQILADALGAGSVTSYAVGGTRIHHLVYSLLSGSAPAQVGTPVAGSAWPGVSSRNGLVCIDAPHNDIGHYPAMNVSPVVPAVITSANTRYLDSVKNMYRTALALASTETRHEQGTGTFSTSPAWTNQSFAAVGSSGGSLAYTTVAGCYWEKSITPPQSGPLAGKVFIVHQTLDASVGTMAQVTTTVDGGSSTNYTPPAWEQYVGVNGSQVNSAMTVNVVTVPVDGAAHTVRLTHAGSGGQYLYFDCLLIPSENPNPIAVGGAELPPVAHAGVFDTAGVNAWRYNAPLVITQIKAAVAEFGNAFYVPSTMTANGLYSGDGLHPNDRGMAQRANDLQTAFTTAARARLESRRLANLADGSFGVV